MADDGKAKISVDTKISPFAEAKGKEPEWFAARPKLRGKLKDIHIKETLTLDPRKWKKKHLQEGVYSVARYELARFATVLSTIQKDIDKAFPPKETKKFIANNRKETSDQKKALDAAEKKVMTTWAKLAGEIEDKVSLALEEVESDKGDNKKAIARGKAALAKFKTLKIEGIYAKISEDVKKVMGKLATDLKADAESKDAWTTAEKGIKACIADFEGDTKTSQDVAKFLLDTGADMKKNKDAAPEMQKLGEMILSKRSPLDKMSDTVDAFEGELNGILKDVQAGKMTFAQVRTRGDNFTKNKSKDAATSTAFKEVKEIGDAYLKAVKAVK